MRSTRITRSMRSTRSKVRNTRHVHEMTEKVITSKIESIQTKIVIYTLKSHIFPWADPIIHLEMVLLMKFVFLTQMKSGQGENNKYI